MTDSIQVLTRLGFTEYEARAYVALLQHEPLNGYELARESKLPRANVYAVLEKLESRGAVIRLEAPAGTRYKAIPPGELTRRLNDQMQDSLSEAEHALSSIGQSIDYEYIWNTRGYPALLEHALSMIEAAQHSVLVALSRPESLLLQRSLQTAAGRGVEITTFCLQACQEECGHCQGRVLRYQITPAADDRWLILVVDGLELLAGQIGAAEDAQSVRTRQRLLVDLAAGYIRRSIALAVLLLDLSAEQAASLTPQARSALQAVAAASVDANWLDQLRGLFQKDRHPLSDEPLP